MNENKTHIDELFKGQLGDYTEMPAASVWDELEERLDEKPKRRGIIWLWMLLFLTATGTVITYTANRNNKKQTVSQTASFNTSDNTESVKSVPVNTQSTPSPALIADSRNTVDQQTKLQKATKTIEKANSQFIASNQPIQSVNGHFTKEEVSGAIPPTTGKIDQREVRSKHQIGFASSLLAKEITKNAVNLLIPVTAIVPITQMVDEDPITAASSSSGKIETVDQLAIVETNPETIVKDTIQVPQGIIAAVQQTIGPIDSIIKQRKTLKLTTGVKAGYEFGVQSLALNGFVLSPYIQYWFAPDLSLMLQPTIKYKTAEEKQLLKDTYHNITSSNIEQIARPNGVGSSNLDYYRYEQEYDSILLSASVERKHKWEADIPIMINYKATRNLEVYGGVNLTIAKPVQIKLDKSAYRITRIDTVSIDPMSTANNDQDLPLMDSVFKHTSLPFGNFDGRQYENPTKNPLKFGVTLGFSYTFKNRYLFDFLIQKSLSDMYYIPNEVVRKMHSQPYFRFTLGYRLTK